jgi:hypothetical protein
MDCDFFLSDQHAKILGATRRGKSGLMEIVSRRIIARALDGMIGIDPHGSYVRPVFEWLSNPQNVNLRGRRIEFPDPASSTHSFGFNPLLIENPTPAKAYDAADLLVSTVEAFFEESAAETPRLVRLLMVLAYTAAIKQLSIRDMLTMVSYSGEAVREAALHGLADVNPLIAGDLQELSVLLAKSPARGSEMTESLRNRLLFILADERMLRILANRRSIDPRKAMDGRDLIFADFSTIPARSARFLGALLTTAFVAAAVRRPPLRCAPFRLLIDEAENLITQQSARLLDQTAKFNLFGCFAIQRLGQLRAKGDFVFDALMTNCPITVCFGLGQDPEAATFMADALLSPFPLEKWKESSKRATAVGNEMVILESRSLSLSRSREKSRSRAEHVAEHEAEGVSRATSVSHGVANTRATGRSIGYSRQRGIASTEGDSHSIGSVRGASLGTTDADMTGWSAAQGTNSGTAEGASLSLTPPDEKSFFPAQPTILGQGVSLTNTTGVSAMSAQMGSHSSARSSVFSSADSEVASSMSAITHSKSEGESESESESEAHTISSAHGESVAHSHATGRSRGRSDTTGESEGETLGLSRGQAQAFVTRYSPAN